MPTQTPNYNFEKPIVGGDKDDWGGYLNGNWDDVDSHLATDGTGLFVGRQQGGTFVGAVTFSASATFSAGMNVTGNITVTGSITASATVTAEHLRSTDDAQIDGTITVNERIRTASGSAAAPAYSFDNDSNTGMYHGGGTSDEIYFARDGSEIARLSGGSTYSASTEIATKSKADDAYLGRTAKAADADKLDGLTSSQFLRSDVDDAFTASDFFFGASTVIHMARAGAASNPTLRFTAYDNSTGFHAISGGGIWAAVEGINAYKMDPDSTDLPDERSVVNKRRLDQYVKDENLSIHDSAGTTANTNFPIGQILLCIAEGNFNRRSAQTVRLDSNNDSYNVGGSGTALPGTWRSCGSVFPSGDNCILMQKVAN